MEDIKGVIPPIITPIDKNEDVDEEKLRMLVDHCIVSGLHGVFVAGSGGEVMALTQAERNKAVRITLDEARGKIPVFCGAIDSSTRRVIENIKYMEQCGAEYAVVTPVFYTATTTQDDIVRHFEIISRKTDINILIYNIPKNTHVNILPETILTLSEIDNVIGLKDSSGNWNQFQKCLFLLKNKGFKIFQGVTEMSGISLLCGANGFIPIYSIFFPKLFLELHEASVKGDVEAMLGFQKIVNGLAEMFNQRNHSVIGAKVLAQTFQMGSIRLCEPSVPLSKEQVDKLAELAESLRDEMKILFSETFDFLKLQKLERNIFSH